MQRKKRKPACVPSWQRVCYKSKDNRVLVVVGAVLIGLGLLLLFLCVPGWAWTALLGFAFICAGLVLFKLAKFGR